MPPDPLSEITELAEQIVRPTHSEFEDLVQEGCLAYYEAIANGRTHASALRAAVTGMRAHLKEHRAYHRPLVVLHDNIISPAEPTYSRSGPDSIPERALAQLSALERKVLDLRYGLTEVASLTERQAAQRLGISKSAVHRAYQRAVEQLKDYNR